MEREMEPPKKRRKVSKACVYCRRSHLTCDDGRPCQRCIKRGIAGLCKDEPISIPKQPRQPPQSSVPPPLFYQPVQFNAVNTQNEADLFAQSGQLVDFDVPLFSKGNQMMQQPPPQPQHLQINHSPIHQMLNTYESPVQMMTNINSSPMLPMIAPQQQQPASMIDQTYINPSSTNVRSPEECVEISADPASIQPGLGLKQIIQAKYEAGLLKPFNYAQSYHELLAYMANFNEKSRMRVLKSIAKFRPFFRDISGRQTDLDLILVEEKFHKLLLEYDRVLSCMGIPAVCW